MEVEARLRLLFYGSVGSVKQRQLYVSSVPVELG